MPFAVCDGIRTRYELVGDGPPLLMFSPGGFNATVENWSTFSIYRRLNLLEHLSAHYTCIVFDKRESGRSGGRIEQVTWSDYARQGGALLDHLDIERAHVVGGCIGCSIALELAEARPPRVISLVLYSPAGGPRYRMTQEGRFEEHVSYVERHGLEAVVELARSSDKSFAQDPRLGPWVNVLRTEDVDIAQGAYLSATFATCESLFFDRDTVPGPEPELLMNREIPALIVPGNDASHALSAAHYLHECLPRSELWNVLPDEQTDENAPQRVLEFLNQSRLSPRSSAAI
jgi:pimeloyl-ACP methyl ester carboxylesterase